MRVTKQDLPDDVGYILLPKKLGWGAALAIGSAVAGGLAAYYGIDRQINAIDRELKMIQVTRATNLAEFKAKDAELTTRVEAMREQAYTRQEAVLSRLSRIEALLERLEKRAP